MKEVIKMMKIIDFGCGESKYPGSIGVDSDARGADVIHDMNTYPYPFEDSVADIIYCSHTLEHLEHPEKALEEFARIIKPGGKIVARVPHASCLGAYAFPLHKHYFSMHTINDFIVMASGGGESGRPTKKLKLKIKKIELIPQYWKRNGIIFTLWKILNYPMYLLINTFPQIYENHFYGIYPIGEVEFTLVGI